MSTALAELIRHQERSGPLIRAAHTEVRLAGTPSRQIIVQVFKGECEVRWDSDVTPIKAGYLTNAFRRTLADLYQSRNVQRTMPGVEFMSGQFKLWVPNNEQIIPIGQPVADLFRLSQRGVPDELVGVLSSKLDNAMKPNLHQARRNVF